MSIFNIKKDISQVKETGKEIEKKSPLLASTTKSIFVIIKWLAILFFIIFIIFRLNLFLEERAKIERQKKYQHCLSECDTKYGIKAITGKNLDFKSRLEEIKKMAPKEEACIMECEKNYGTPNL